MYRAWLENSTRPPAMITLKHRTSVSSRFSLYNLLNHNTSGHVGMGLIVLGFTEMSTFVGHSVLSP